MTNPMERSAAWTVLLEQGFFEGLTGNADSDLTTRFLDDFHASGATRMWEYAQTWGAEPEASPVPPAETEASFATSGHQIFPEMLEGLRQGDAEDARRLEGWELLEEADTGRRYLAPSDPEMEA